MLFQPAFDSTVDHNRRFSPQADVMIGNELVGLPICGEQHVSLGCTTPNGDAPLTLSYVNEATVAVYLEDHARRYHKGGVIDDRTLWRTRRKE